jgi:hypothetical protein
VTRGQRTRAAGEGEQGAVEEPARVVGAAALPELGDQEVHVSRGLADQVPEGIDVGGAGERLGEDGAGGLGVGLEREPLLDQCLGGSAELEQGAGDDAVSVGSRAEGTGRG